MSLTLSRHSIPPFDQIRAKTRRAIFRRVVLFYQPAPICGAHNHTEGFLAADVSSAALQREVGRSERTKKKKGGGGKTPNGKRGGGEERIKEEFA